MFKEIIEKTLDNSFNVRDEFKGFSVEELQLIAKESALPFRVCAVNVEGDLNIGMMIRSASLLGVEKFYTFGRRKFDRRSMVGAQNYLPIERISGLDKDGEVDYLSFVNFCEREKMVPFLVETGGTPLTEWSWEWAYLSCPADYTMCLVFGNESNGFPPSFVNSDLKKISIPQLGVLRSFNVSAAASIIMWDFYKWWTDGLE